MYVFISVVRSDPDSNQIILSDDKIPKKEFSQGTMLNVDRN